MHLGAEDCLSPKTLNGTAQEVQVAATSSVRAPRSSLLPLPTPLPSLSLNPSVGWRTDALNAAE